MRRRMKMNRRDKWLVYTTAPSQNLFRFDLTSDVTPDIIITPQQQSLIDTGPTHCDARRTSIRARLYLHLGADWLSPRLYD